MQLCQGENFFFFSTLVVQEDLILFQLVRPLHRFLLPSSGFPFFWGTGQDSVVFVSAESY